MATPSAAAAFVALADPTRRAVFERVARRPQAVGRIAAGLRVTRPAVSQHLRVLGRAGLVTHTRVGTRRIYRLDTRGLDAMRRYLDTFWDRALEAFAAAVDASAEGQES
jgi:DNA-binding transcriptional ArsR family regulator